jgi:SAM-dependent methyltransferase
MPLPRRLVFGQVAELYDRARPTYPDALIRDLAALAAPGGERRVLEVGAGTGKATRLIAGRGLAVLAIEPSAEMAAVARRSLAAEPQVEIVESDFETWDPAGERFSLVYSAQAWHWIDPGVRDARARAALIDGGVLAVFWNRPAWGESPVRRALSDAYRAAAPEMPNDGPLHPDNPDPLSDEGEEWAAEIRGAAGLAEPEVRRYDWGVGYSADEYADLLATLSEIRLLAPGPRERLLAGVRTAIREHGGQLQMPMATSTCLAHAV